MTDTAATPQALPKLGASFHVHSWPAVYTALVALTLAYAVLFYSQDAPSLINADGIAVAIFLTLLTITLACMRARPLPQAEKRAFTATAISLPALFLEPTAIACGLTTLCLASLVSIRLSGWPGDMLRSLGNLAFLVPLFVEALLKRRYNRSCWQLSKKDWGIPFFFVGLSALLITIANPFVTNTLAETLSLTALVNPHYFVTLFVAMGLYLLLMVSPLQNIEQPEAYGPLRAPRLVSETAIMRTLIGANLVFAVQTISDVGVMVFGASLPDGASYSSYMYSAIWPLMGAACLTAVFTLYAFPDRRMAPPSRTVTIGVLVWITQAAFLTLTCALRIWDYIEAYGMTNLRLAGLFWVALVIAGLLCVAARFLHARDTRWLINNCAAAIFGTLLIGAYAPWTAFIANWNVERHITQGQKIDIPYLVDQGALARTALRRLSKESPYRATAYEAQEALYDLEDIAPPHANANWRDLTVYRWVYR